MTSSARRTTARASRTGELSNLIQPTLHVPESKNVDELLTEIQDNRMQMVIVIDEFGTTEGLVTIEDMVEEIVGEILDGDEEEPIEPIDDDTVARPRRGQHRRGERGARTSNCPKARSSRPSPGSSSTVRAGSSKRARKSTTTTFDPRRTGRQHAHHESADSPDWTRRRNRTRWKRASNPARNSGRSSGFVRIKMTSYDRMAGRITRPA